ncbi:MAG: glycosyltransferase family 39 protein [Acidobacteriota bacterium]|nr:glycosyltransferase family 39 protein [Acidobacteriota bacterium]
MKERKTVLLLWLAAIVFRALHYWLFSNEMVVGNDQMQNILLARRFAAGDFYGVLDVYWTPLYPILVGSAGYFTNSLTLPSIIVSILAGSLAVPLTFYLINQSYGRREALIAAVIAVFYPHLINSVFGLGTETVYLIWIIGALIVGWNGLQRNSVKDFLLTGFLLGLAYLTRREAAGYLFFFVTPILLKNLRLRKPSARSQKQIVVLLLGFTILAAPYILYLRGTTGHWTISGKAQTNVAAGMLQETGDADAEVTPSGKQTGIVLVKSFALSLIEIQKIFTFLLPSLLLLFVALGLFGERWSRERLKRESYLIFFGVLTIVGYALAVSQVRYFYILLPICFGWMARGIIQAERWLGESIQIWSPNNLFYFAASKKLVILSLIFIYLYALPINFFMRSPAKIWHDNAFEERDAGLWLKANGKPSPLVFSASSRAVFYAGGEQISPTANEYISQCWQNQKERFKINPHRHTSGLNT